MPAWIHDRAKHIRRKNPGMSESQSFAIATQQAHATGNTPKDYGTAEGKRKARRKYDEPPSQYKQTADPKTKKAHDLSTSPAVEAGRNTRRLEMHTKLAGRLPLHEMIAQHLDAARVKVAAAEEKDDEKKKVKKLVDYEKKEHGKVPSVKDEEDEHKKEAGVLDFHDPDQVEKLASALEVAGDQFLEKEADSIENGAEGKQGGEQLATQSPTGGKQPYKRDAAKHQVPAPGTKATKDNPGPSNAMETDDARAPGGTGAKYPAKGVLKTAGQTVLERIAAKKAEAEGEVEEPVEETAVEEPVDAEKAKKASAADYILGKLAEFEGGGEKTPDDEKKAPGSGSVAVPSNAGRQLIRNNQAPVSANKREAKSPRKAELAQVLTEPAMTRSTDSKVHENLRNATLGGVKIAAATAFLRKIAEEGCTCGKKGECRHCKLKGAVEAKKAS
jgi:hypothetical protein